MMFVAAEDKQRNAWSSLLTGDPGFFEIKNKRNFTINSQFIDIDPLANQLHIGSDIGILGIQFETRRRSRISAKIQDVNDAGMNLDVKQCYGNCPKYIQLRKSEKSNLIHQAESIAFDHIDDEMKHFIHNVDSLFIASESKGDTEKSNTGFDSSHRGGMPGFVQVSSDKTILIPDFMGNNFFNTVGNILNNPKVGLQFLDYENGHRVMLTGTAEVIWATDQELPFDGVDRMIRFTLKQGYLLTHCLPFKWEFKGYSPFSKAYAGEDSEK